MSYVWHYQSPLGEITLASDGRALTGTWFTGQTYFGSTLDKEIQKAGLPVFRQACQWLDTYFKGQNPGVIPAVRLEGTSFRLAVWDVLRHIPYGRVMTYGEIAKMLGGNRMSAQAIGGAVGHNPVSIFIPCHRVVGAGGKLTGYAGGLERKRRLLELERSFGSITFCVGKCGCLKN